MSPDDTFADVPRRGQLNEEVASGSGSAAVTSGTDPAAAGANNRRSAQSSPVRSSSTGSKMMAVRVQMLDDSITVFQVQTKASGRILFDQVCKQLNLLEVDYFGLEYQDQQDVTYWLDLDKQMNHQVGLFHGQHSTPAHAAIGAGVGQTPSMHHPEALLRFCVKFYTPDPAQIEEEYTRYLFSLQIKRDLAMGQLQCNHNTAALMASYIVQAECGDFVAEDYPDASYLSSFKFVPQQDLELERKIMENHKKHVGQSPAEADLNLLETARRCELYGTKMHSAKDHEGVSLNLAVVHSGILVFQNLTRINTFSWAKIRKVSFKRKKFLIKLHPEGYGYFNDTMDFYFEDRNHCKNFWKKCVEHHTFFRCSATVQKQREKRRILSRGSSFRYSGKTQKQMQEYVRENFVKRQSFQRHVRNLHSSMGNVGQSLSIQPLLPIGDNGVAGQSFSLSCGAIMNADNDISLSSDIMSAMYPRRRSENYPRLQHQHQSANNTPKRVSMQSNGVSFGSYATLATPYAMNSAGGKFGGTGISFYHHDTADSDCSLSKADNSVVERRQKLRHQEYHHHLHHQHHQHHQHQGGGDSSEDNLSHESYELIEKNEQIIVVETTTTALPNTPTVQIQQQSQGVSKFEEEFYRQAAADPGKVASASIEPTRA